MAKRPLPSPELLRKLVDYDPFTGVLVWKPRPIDTFATTNAAAIWNSGNANKQAFNNPDGRGYHRGKVLGKNYKAHRLAWTLHYGEWPTGEIDHINGDRTDNRIANLREVGRLENARNKPRQRNNKSGVTGVTFNKRRKTWFACIKQGGKNMSLGHYIRFEDAVAARKEAERTIGFHANHGR